MTTEYETIKHVIENNSLHFIFGYLSNSMEEGLVKLKGLTKEEAHKICKMFYNKIREYEENKGGDNI